MLVDPNMRADSRISKEILALIDHRNVGIIRLGQGLYQCGHWNFENLCSNTVDGSPEFNQSITNYIERLRWELIGDEWWPTARNNNSWFQKQVQAAHRMPDNVDALYRKENWKDQDGIYLDAYGVCDSPEQLLSLYDFEADPRKFCISFVKIERAYASPRGGWRWHKWGNYVGLKSPQMEYLYDEPDIEAVYTFHIYEVG